MTSANIHLCYRLPDSRRATGIHAKIMEVATKVMTVVHARVNQGASRADLRGNSTLSLAEVTSLVYGDPHTAEYIQTVEYNVYNETSQDYNDTDDN